MGMAASQARYLTLSARKTNTEYEGQQLNQQRVNLANQSADLFNQMLTMSVPVCPDSNDFTKIQYSYSDGINEFVLGDFYQISVPNEEYNYVVSEYHYDNVYTGKSYSMNDPQIQAQKTNNFINYKEKDYLITQKIYDTNSDSYIFGLTRNGINSTNIFNAATPNENADEVELLDYLYGRTALASPNQFTYDESTDTYTFTPTNDPDFGLYSSRQGSVTYTKVDMEDYEQKRNLLKSYGAKYDPKKTYYVSETGNSYFCEDDLKTTDISSGQKIEIRQKDLEDYYTDGEFYFKASDITNLDVDDTLMLRKAENAPSFSNYTAIGNCKLEAISVNEYNSNEDLQIELKRIIDDVKPSVSERKVYSGGKREVSPPIPSSIPSIPDEDFTPDPSSPESLAPDTPAERESDVPEDDNFTLSRGHSATKTIKADSSTQLTLTNPFDNSQYTYKIQARDGYDDQSVYFEFLKNGRLYISGNNIQVIATNGQKDDIILKGKNNYLDTGDRDDIVRVGFVVDSNGYDSDSNNNTIKTGSGNDHIMYRGGGNYIDAGGGNDTIGGYYQNSLDYNTVITDSGDVSRTILSQDTNNYNLRDGWSNQGTANDCRLLSLINSLTRNTNSGSLSQYYQVQPVSGGYNVTFPNYNGSAVDDNTSYASKEPYKTKKNDNTIKITEQELASYSGVYGDKDTILLDLAMNKLIKNNQDMNKTNVGDAYYNTLSNYLFGNDKVTLILSDGNSNFTNELSQLWTLYNNNTISNLTVGITSGDNSKNGIISKHAYSVKNFNDEYVTLVNPWDDADVLNIDRADFNRMGMYVVVYGWADDDNTWGLQQYDGKRAYIPNGGMVVTYNDLGLGGEEISEICVEALKSSPPLSQYSVSQSNGLANCFSDTGEYIDGSIYKFTMFGKTYYTTAADLDDSLLSALRKDATATNGIDSQHDKLSYYSTVYLNTRIKESRKALIETDGKGRFSSVKFEDDSTVYTLNVETITDEEAYRNAMNKYFYNQEKYDKAVADINTKTKRIQAEDRELQLRLEQLGTEQTALQTEMEACQKVVSKSIESTFKTFGGQ